MNDPSKADGRAEAFESIKRALDATIELLMGDDLLDARQWNQTVDGVERAIESLKSLMEDE